MVLGILSGSPKAIGRYEVLAKLGNGGVGLVYKGRDRDSGAVVAIKVLNAEWADNPKLVSRFRQEFRAAAKLDHPNIVAGLDFGHEGGLVYLVMEFVDGESLGDRIDRAGPLPEAAAVRVITQVAQALQYAHARRIIHRDVKPDNILLRTDGRAKLTDFGLVKDLEEDLSLTRPSTGLGSPHFMPPEQYADAKNVSVRSDVYSLAATLYMALTGKLPFHACATLTALRQKIKGEITPVRTLAPDVSEQTDRAVRRAMSPDPQERPASCAEFVVDLIGETKPAGLAGPSDPPGAERRASVRYACVGGTRCVRDASLLAEARGEAGDEETWPAAVVDISATGVGLVLARRFEPGTVVTVELGRAGLPVSAGLAARVVRVQPDTLGHWRHGCAFEDPLPEGDLAAGKVDAGDGV